MKVRTNYKMSFKNKKVIVPLILFLILLTVRMVAQPLIHQGLNKFLSDFSPVMEFHVDDLDISFLKGSYNFDSVTGKLKGKDNNFVEIKEVKVSVAWGDIFKGKINTEMYITGLDFSYTKELKEALAKVPKQSENETVATLIPFTMNQSGVHLDKGEILSKAIEHGFKEKLTPGIENRFNLK